VSSISIGGFWPGVASISEAVGAEAEAELAGGTWGCSAARTPLPTATIDADPSTAIKRRTRCGTGTEEL
jgi:hypothetical protein